MENQPCINSLLLPNSQLKEKYQKAGGNFFQKMHRLNLVYVANQNQIDERAFISVAQKMEFWKIKSEEKRGLKPVVSSRRTSGLAEHIARKAAL